MGEDPLKYEQEVCSPLSFRIVSELISKLKLNRSPWVDKVTTSMLKHASPYAVNGLTNLYNEMLYQSITPESLNLGKMTPKTVCHC